MKKLDTSKITVLDAHFLVSGDTKTWPQEGWFVGQLGNGKYKYAYLERPRETKYEGQFAWEGVEKTKDGETIFHHFGNGYECKCAYFAFHCADEKTAHDLCKMLNEIGDFSTIGFKHTCSKLNKEIEKLLVKRSRLEGIYHFLHMFLYGRED